MMSRSNWLPLKSMIVASLSESFPEAYPVSVKSQTLQQNPQLAQSANFPYGVAMEVHLTPDQKAFAQQAIESGRLHREEEAVQEALALWEARERSRAEILLAIDNAEASLASGSGRVISQPSMQELADEVKQRGRARLAAEQSPVR